MQAIENGIKAQGFSLAKLPEELLNTPYIFSQYAESDSSTSRKKQNLCSFPLAIPGFVIIFTFKVTKVLVVKEKVHCTSFV
jgi:hypothetical protein